MHAAMLVSSFIVFLSCLSLVSAAPLCGLVPPQSSNNSFAATSGTGTSANTSTVNYVAAAWYPGWDNASLPLNNVSWTKYTHMTYAFAETTANGSLSLANSSASNVPQFVSLAHANNVKALVSVGGWTGGIYFSQLVATADSRTQFVDTCYNLIQQYGLDGLDFDWEYPTEVSECNTQNSTDSANYLLFLQELRAKLPSAEITLSVGTSPFLDATGTPMTNVSGFADVVTYIAIMNYDVYGLFSNPAIVGPNAPIALSTCSSQTGPSATSAVALWSAAGMPPSQIVLGVPSYGHSFIVEEQDALVNNQLVLYPPFDTTQNSYGPGETATSAAVLDSCGKTTGVSGVYSFAQMITAGFLDTTGAPANGISHLFDSNCSQTPYVYNSNSQVMISYDDAQSFGDKGQFIVDQGLRGFAMYSATDDYNDILLDAINSAMLDGDCDCSS
ncbi:hypothetical protein H0H92_014337 [Tricholoma furcatifolium]|nr:hypothetical protein H0H92_014337 [Tricholoma furcatifolium]